MHRYPRGAFFEFHLQKWYIYYIIYLIIIF